MGTRRMGQRARHRSEQSELRSFLQILALSGFAVAQPVLDVFGRSPETFVFRGAAPATVVAFAVAVALVPAIALWLLVLPVRVAGPEARRWAQAGVAGLLVGIVAVQVLKRFTPLLGSPLAAAGAVAAAGAIFGFARARAVRDLTVWGAAAPVAFVVLFLTASPAAKLLASVDLDRAASAEPAGARPLVMVVFDELPALTLMDAAGDIDAELFPNFAALAREATWYRDYTVTYPFTEHSMPTLLTGTLTTDRGKKALAVDYPENLFTVFRDSHRLVVHEQVTELCPRELCSDDAGQDEVVAEEADEADDPGEPPIPMVGEDVGLSPLLGDAVGVWSELSAPVRIERDVTGQFVTEGDDVAPAPREEQEETAEGDGRRPAKVQAFYSFLASIEGPSDPPGLYFGHVMLPHIPWRFYPSGVSYDRLRQGEDLPGVWDDGPARWSDQEWPVLLTRQRHVLQARYVDALLGELVDRLHEVGLYDDAVLVVTSDHGQSFHPGRRWRSPTEDNIHETLWVPLLVKAPGQGSGGPDDANLMGMDLLPTIAELMGVEIPWEMDGLPAGHPEVAGRGPEKVISSVLAFGTPDPQGPGRHIIAGPVADAARRRLREETFRAGMASADPELSTYAVGPGASLVGTALDELTIGSPSGRSVTLRVPDRAALRDVDVGSGRPLPGMVWGAMEGPAEGMQVAAALNGRMAGVSTTFSRGDEHGLIGLMLPEDWFRQGRNRLELFVLEGRALRPLEVR